MKLIVFCIYLILRSSYGDDDTKDVQGGWKDNKPFRPHYTTTFRPADPFYPEFRVVLGNRTELPCSVENEKGLKLNVSWSRTDGHPLPVNSSQRSGVLYIDNVEKEARGEYKCTALDFNGTPVFDIKVGLTVLIPPKITLTSSILKVYPGEHAYINCSATGDQPIEIYWLRWGVPIPSSVYTRDGYISFNSTQLQDAGRYLCVANNRAGKAEAEVNITVEVPPKITLTSRKLVAHPGEYHFINCSTTGDQPINISWSSLGRDMPNSVYIKDGYISFNSTQLQDAGRYLCVATNRAGKAGAVADVIVEVPPTIILSSTTLVLRQGESGFVDCYASGDQPINISWSASGRDMSSSVYIRDRVIGFKNIQPQDAGKYLCVAKNRAGEANATVDVIIKVPPSITVNPPNLVARTGVYNSINCIATGDKPIEIYWLPYRRAMMPTSVYVSDGYINFNPIQYQHQGTYLCVAKNPVGMAEAFVDVRVTA
ncbi:basement membrane-specific heparan sulfate proteoglycan core protein-like isoform X1 [Diabrotica undecimpunctata]|uniref:basement membrane-specific heparan sulfate proteoglycan core protein-like isoform X1 n=1 Tax=Diabrotica undecimpunctata TaxID=50387 RepID=UPI003B633C5F